MRVSCSISELVFTKKAVSCVVLEAAFFMLKIKENYTSL